MEGEQDALRNFLSLYNLTVGDGDASNQNGSWEEIPIANGRNADDKTTIRSALFGGGTQATSAIQHIYFGDAPKKGSKSANANTWSRSWTVLRALNVPGSTYDGHENHCHVDFRVPDRISIDPSAHALTVASDIGATNVTTTVLNSLETIARDTVEELGLLENDMDMYYVDNLKMAKAPAVLVAQAPSPGRERAMGVCVAIEMTRENQLGLLSVSPVSDAGMYFSQFNTKQIPTLPSFDSIRITRQPEHGTLTREKNAVGRDIYVYHPDFGYLGKDRFEAVVPVGNDTVRIVYNVVVQSNSTEREDFDNRKFCPKTEWKISSSADDTANLQALITAVGINSVITAKTCDLSGGVVGQTTGTTITLDSTAAGHSWYIDYTPYLNEEYLPTSNPNEWIAKPGSEAEGKMDMLSVLLHEYGHALGIEHSADPHDFMGATLAPGVRRLPSADELALMAKLVAQAKGDVPAPADPALPDRPGAPLPGRSNTVRVARARIAREGTFIDAFDNADAPPQYEVAANPTLADPKLQTGTGWETTGKVAIGSGAAILSEADKTQTRLNQVFLVGPHDRYLTFTVAGVALYDQANAPDDAFEAALLDANSGASLLAGTGLTHNDAFLNLQADGSEHEGQQVTSIRNADGSRTYRVDLAGIPAGTAVNLSFDLIGFGAATSHVTVRDIRLGVPETHDDAIAAQEDTPIDIAATANDLDADQPGFVPVVVTGPSHGDVVINPDGSFRFTPAANWNGEDSFSYKLTDGSVDSNIATVHIGTKPWSVPGFADKAEYFVRVTWLDTVPEAKAVNEVGLFGNQNTVCQPLTPKWRHTVERLKTYFSKWDA